MKRIVSEFPAACRVVAPPPQKVESLLDWFVDVSKRCGLTPDVAFEAHNVFLNQARYRFDDGRDLFFLTNGSMEKSLTVRAKFRAGDRTPWLWDPETGERRVHPWQGTRNELMIRLEPGESRLIVFEDAAAPAPEPEPQPAEDGAFEVGGSWQLHLSHVNGSRHDLTVQKLQNIGELEGQKGFAGTAVYRLKFNVPAAGVFRWLDLGNVRDISEVTLNGRALGCRWYGRHLYALPAAVKPGNNELEVRVTTVLGNYCKTLTENETAQRWTQKLPHQPMGLLGPVRLLR
jgi:hypothetical protein